MYKPHSRSRKVLPRKDLGWWRLFRETVSHRRQKSLGITSVFCVDIWFILLAPNYTSLRFERVFVQSHFTVCPTWFYVNSARKVICVSPTPVSWDLPTSRSTTSQYKIPRLLLRCHFPCIAFKRHRTLWQEKSYFLEGVTDWSWNDLVVGICLEHDTFSCETFCCCWSSLFGTFSSKHGFRQRLIKTGSWDQK